MLNTVRNPEFKENPGQVMADLFGDHASLAMQKKEELCEAGVAEEEAWTRVLSDFMYRYYSDGLARKLADEGNPVWCYSFEYAPAVHGRGFHFMMNEWDAPQGTEPEEAEQLAAFMRRNVRAFLCDGEPEEKSWRPYEGKHKMIFTAEPHMEERPEDTLSGFPVQVYTRG